MRTLFKFLYAQYVLNIASSLYHHHLVDLEVVMTLIIDNGGHQIKAGLDTHTYPVVILNCTAKVQKSMQYLVSDQILQYSHNRSLLHFIRPLDMISH